MNLYLGRSALKRKEQKQTRFNPCHSEFIKKFIKLALFQADNFLIDRVGRYVLIKNKYITVVLVKGTTFGMTSRKFWFDGKNFEKVTQGLDILAT